jgi:hypothetical protein
MFHGQVVAREMGKEDINYSHDSNSIVVEYCWDILGGELIGSV